MLARRCLWQPCDGVVCCRHVIPFAGRGRGVAVALSAQVGWRHLGDGRTVYQQPLDILYAVNATYLDDPRVASWAPQFWHTALDICVVKAIPCRAATCVSQRMHIHLHAVLLLVGGLRGLPWLPLSPNALPAAEWRAPGALPRRESRYERLLGAGQPTFCAAYAGAAWNCMHTPTGVVPGMTC